jgi:hypothetical protein
MQGPVLLAGSCNKTINHATPLLGMLLEPVPTATPLAMRRAFVEQVRIKKSGTHCYFVIQKLGLKIRHIVICIQT